VTSNKIGQKGGEATFLLEKVNWYRQGGILRKRILSPFIKKISIQEVSVQAAILDGLGDMGRADIFFSCQIGNGPSHLQNPGIRPRTQAEFINGHFQKPLARIVNGTESLHVPIGHLGVTMDLRSTEPIRLNLSGPIDSFFQYPGGFHLSPRLQVLTLFEIPPPPMSLAFEMVWWGYRKGR